MTNDKQLVSEFFKQAYDNHDYNFVRTYFSHSPAAARSHEEYGTGVARLKFEGTHTGEYMGVKSTGKTVCFEAIEIFKVVSNKVTESWDTGLI